MKFSPFKKFQVWINTKGYRVLNWTYSPNLNYVQGTRLIIEKSKNCQQWQIIAPDVSDTFYVDQTQPAYNKYCTDYYRLHLNVTDLQDYFSDPQIAGRALCWPYSAKANNLIRLAQLEISRTGRNGILLKRKTFGQRCPQCTHFDQQQSVNQHCPVCLGTGIKGGYQKGIPLNILQTGQQQMQNVLQDGYSNDQTITAKCVAWPFIQRGDVWVDPIRNQRYFIETASVASKCRNVPLVYNMKLNLLEYTDVMHSAQADQLTKRQDVQQTMTLADPCQFDKEFDEL